MLIVTNLNFNKVILMNLNGCKLIEFPKITDSRGALSVVESNIHIPFLIQRIFHLFEMPGGTSRAGHAHKELQQLLIAMSGSFDVHLTDGNTKMTYHLNKPNIGLYIPPMIWGELNNFSSGAVCVVLASDIYREEDYFRNYQEFLKASEKLK